MTSRYQPQIDEFVALVSDGKPISGYDPPCPHCKRTGPGEVGAKRKRTYLHLGKIVLEALQIELGSFDKEDERGHQRITVNEGGIAISGDIALDIGWVRVGFYPGAYQSAVGDFQYNFRLTPKRWEQGGWAKWKELRDMPKLAEKIKLSYDSLQKRLESLAET
jgi:hypothetical protein